MAMARRVAERPAGKVTAVFSVEAEREAAFRFVESDEFSAVEIGAAAHRATARRSEGERFVCVPMDQTDLRITDRKDSKSLGAIGDKRTSARGLEVIDAIATTLDGKPLGMCAQVHWARSKKPLHAGKKDPRLLHEKETRRWLEAMRQVRTAFEETGVTTTPWFQIDRGGDAWPLLIDAKLAETSWMTVRASHSRRLLEEDGERDHLWERVEREEILGTYDLDVPARAGGRAARSATLQLQACHVVLDVQRWPERDRVALGMWAVRVREIETTPEGETPIEWMLLTTFPIRDRMQDAITVVLAYATRWRIEELHKLWKSGACRIEESQLGEREHLEKWATISASVAIRLLRLTYLSRHHPELPATEELSRAEIDAVILLTKPKGTKRGATPNISTAVRWIADYGGYTGKSSGGPPGAIVIARGLERIQAVAQVINDGKM